MGPRRTRLFVATLALVALALAGALAASAELAANAAPVANPDSATTSEARATTIAVLANDSDRDGNPISVASVDTTGTKGRVSITASGTIAYDPAHAFDSLTSSESAHDSFTYRASDGQLQSNAATVTVTITGASTPPTITTSAGATPYVEGAAAAAVDPGLTLTDPDSGNVAAAQVRIANGFQPGDELVFASQNGISGSYNAGTGVLALSGSAAKAYYQTALRSVRYRSGSNHNPLATKTIEFTARGTTVVSAAATKRVAVTPVNDAPALTASAGQASYSEGSAPVQPDPGLVLADPDSAQMHGATAAISLNFRAADGDRLAFTPQPGIAGTYDAATGVLTLTGAAPRASYEAALRSVAFSLTSDTPSTLTRGVSFRVTDASGAQSAAATRNVGVSATNDAPAVRTSAGSTAYTEGAPATVVDAGVTVADADHANLASAQARISGGFQAGDQLAFDPQTGITGTYNATTGVLALSGSAPKATYQAALRSVRYRSGSNRNPVATKTVELRASDGSASSLPATKQLAVTRVNDAPAVTTSTGQATYTVGGSPVPGDPAVSISDPDSAQLQSLRVAIAAGFTPADGDRLSVTPPTGITSTYDPATGVLTLSGLASVASYQAAARSVAFSLTSRSPSTVSRTLAFRATDAAGAPGNGATRQVAVTADPLDAKIDHNLAFAASQLNRTLAETPANVYPHETGSDGRWENYSPGWWISGFFPGNLWLMYEATGDAAWRTAAQTRQAGVESQKTRTDTHDLGFMIFDSFGNGFRLTGTTAYRDVALTAAASLATRYSATVGATRSWNNPSGAPASDFRVVIDNMMNLELLFWAAKNGGDPALAGRALQHALTTAREHVRADGSTHHLVIFDSTSGAVKSKQTVQGYSNTSTWARGQAWGLYGFTMAYRESNDSRMLDTARRVADWYIAHLPADRVPYWDFNAAGIPNEPRDSSAAAIAASGLIELSRLDPDPARRQRYLSSARETLTSLSSPAYLAEGTANRALLLHGTSNKPGGRYDRGLIYGDYYFLEAMLRYRALNP